MIRNQRRLWNALVAAQVLIAVATVLRLIESSGNEQNRTRPSVANDQNWADHMQRYASQITAPNLAAEARQLADLSNQVVVQDARTHPSSDPGRGPCPWAATYLDIATKFHIVVDDLQRACPA